MKVIVNKNEFAYLIRNCEDIQMHNAAVDDAPPCAGCLLEGECEYGVEELCEVVEDEANT